MKDIFSGLNNIDKSCACLLTSPHNMRYFSGFSGGEGYVLILLDASFVIVDSRYTGIAKEEAYSGFEVIEYNSSNPLYKILNEKLLDYGIKSIIYEDLYTSVFDFNALKTNLASFEFIGKSKEIERLRMIKSEDELEFLRKAESIGVDAFNHVLKYIKSGVTEAEISAELEYYMKKHGASGTSFDTIVLFGERTALPHGMPGDRRLKENELVLMDFGCKYHGYCSDMTRTVSYKTPIGELSKIYEILKEAQEIGLNTIKSGILGSEADKAARDYIKSAGYGEYFGHSLGHGVGMLIHELPNLSPKSDIILEENMIVSCEPGIYIYGLGGVRIEDLVCVKNGGFENLTNLTKELIIIE